MSDQELRAALLGSPLLFTSTFYEIVNGRPFTISCPVGREPHAVTICKALKRIFLLSNKRQIISIPPGHGKSTFLSYFMAWTYAHYPDCNNIYTTHSADKASDVTYECKLVLESSFYKKLFPDTVISRAYSGKDDFKTDAGGRTKAFGIDGPITGCNAGYPYCDRYTGALFMDDLHKPGEIFSPARREGVIRKYNTVLKNRARGPNVPIFYIGHTLHQQDIVNFLKSGQDGSEWEQIILPAEDVHGNILDESLTTREYLDLEKKYNEYFYWSQLQQNPIIPGGSIFKDTDFLLLDKEPQILATFMTIDTAETDKNYNDPTVFSFWGIYKLIYNGIDTGEYGLHWLDCREIWVQPKELESQFWDFFKDSMRHPVKPGIVMIEKKSTGVTLASVLDSIPGLKVLGVERTKASGNKIARYFEMQRDVSKHKITFTRGAIHAESTIKHMTDLTENGAHAHDDRADTAYDAWCAVYKDKIITSSISSDAGFERTAQALASVYQSNNNAYQNMLRGLANR